MELLIRETVGQVLNMKALFRDVNEALQRSITNLRIKKMGILFLKWPGVTSTADKIKWTNPDEHLSGVALIYLLTRKLTHAQISMRQTCMTSIESDLCYSCMIE